MSENTNTTNTTPTTTATPVAEHVITYKDKPIRLTRHETQAKGNKPTVAYWGIDAAQFTTDLKNSKGEPETDVVAIATYQVNVLASLIGWSEVRDMVYGKVNVNLKAAQLDNGKDTFSMDNKATYAKDYIMADFGANSRVGGGAAIKALKEMNTKQSAILAQLVSLHKQFATAQPTEAAAILAKIQALTMEAATLTQQ